MKSALSDIEHEMFEFTEDFPVIKTGLGWVVFDCKCRKGEIISVVELTPVRGKIGRRIIKPVNRGFNAVIEAAIHATRYVSLKEKKYLREIKKCDKIVRKCGEARDMEAMKMLYELIGSS